MLLGLTIAGCSHNGLGPAVTDEHGTVEQRMWAIAVRFEQDRHKGGMSEVISDIDQCYASAAGFFTHIFALRDCLILDYAAYRTDVMVGRKLGGTLPYFTDQAATARWGKYGSAAQIDTPQRIRTYVRNASDEVMYYDTTQLNAAPLKDVCPIYRAGQPFRGID